MGKIGYKIASLYPEALVVTKFYQLMVLSVVKKNINSRYINILFSLHFRSLKL